MLQQHMLKRGGLLGIHSVMSTPLDSPTSLFKQKQGEKQVTRPKLRAEGCMSMYACTAQKAQVFFCF